MDKKKLKMKKAPLVFVLILGLLLGGYFVISKILPKEEVFLLENYTGREYKDFLTYASKNKLLYEVSYEESNVVSKDIIISFSTFDKFSKDKVIKVVVSKGGITKDDLISFKVNESGKVPIMMYHGIVNKKKSETKYIGGNVDKDGYNRTTEAFRNDLEYYYQEGYRMIRLNDYINGKIDVSLGKSPIILTFDDGREDNFKVLGLNDDGSLKIDPNCAIGVLEEFKKKYQDFSVTATFFLNASIFEQKEYNQKILEWLFTNGYDVGNHTLNHLDFTKISFEESNKQVGGMYEVLDKYAKNKYVNIIALPFGSPYKTTHANFKAIMDPQYNGKTWKTVATLRVGWEAENSPFSKDFNQTFLKRIRAYDNDGKDFDIKMVFTNLIKNKYISDGDKETVTIPLKMKDDIKTSLKVVTY